MLADIVWTPQARDDLLDIWVSIGRHDPAAAERMIDRILHHVELLHDNPLMGMLRPDIRRDLRILVETPYVILYRANM